MSWFPPQRKKSAGHKFGILFEKGGRLQQDGLLWVLLHIITLSLREFKKIIGFMII